jgi:hypothetical protein
LIGPEKNNIHDSNQNADDIYYRNQDMNFKFHLSEGVVKMCEGVVKV